MKINSVVSFRGEIYTDSYGNSNAAEDSLDNDDQKVSLVSIFVGPKECEMVSDFFQFYDFSRVFTNFSQIISRIRMKLKILLITMIKKFCWLAFFWWTKRKWNGEWFLPISRVLTNFHEFFTNYFIKKWENCWRFSW